MLPTYYANILSLCHMLHNTTNKLSFYVNNKSFKTFKFSTYSGGTN